MDIATLTSSIEQLSERRLLLRGLDTRIPATIQREEDLEAKIIEAETTQETILNKISQIQKAVELHTSTTFHPLSVSATEFMPSDPAPRRELSVTASNLPKLNLPTFAGDPLTWQSFWNLFDAAVNSNNHSIRWCPEVQLSAGTTTWRCFPSNCWIPPYKLKL